MNKNEILRIVKCFYQNTEEGNSIDKNVERLKFPKHIDISAAKNEDGVNCRIILDPKSVREKNMQEDCNAFEGWSIVIYTALREQYHDLTVMLGLKNDSHMKDSGTKDSRMADSGLESGENSLHWARFLYRADRFCRQYAWFHLSRELADALETAAEIFRKHIGNHGQYINNVPKNEAGIKADRNKENVVEAYLAEGTRLKEVLGNIFEGEKVYRQLPTGLFRDCAKDSSRVFPGGKSAIDLWSWKDDTVYVVELKTSNPMIGMITEIFFYANFMQDLLIEKTFTLNHTRSKSRGYGELFTHTFHNIKGIMLADQYHPTLAHRTEDILAVMNHNGSVPIRYYKKDYKYDLAVLPK